MKINWKIRFQNPTFIAQIILSIMLPILGYMGLEMHDITSWSILWHVIGDAFMNPYCLGLIVVSLYNATIDPTTKGNADSKRVMDKTRL